MTKLPFGATIGVGAICAVLAAGPAGASDVLTYPPGPPPPTSPLYAPASMVTGDVAVAGGWWGQDGFSAFELFGTGRVNVPFQGGPWNVTGEIAGLAAFEDPTWTEFLGYAHLYHKTEQYAHGVYAGAAGYWSDGFSGHTLGVGIEGAAFMGNTTLVGRLGHYWNHNPDFAYWKAEGIARYYVTPNTKLAGLVGWWSDPDSGWMLAGGVEHLFAGSHVTGFARASWFTEGSNDNWWEVVGGARFLFGRPGTTLQQHDWDLPFAEATVVNF